MKDLLEFIAKRLVNNPDAVTVTETASADRVSLGLTVAPDDVGRVIGRGGSIAKDLRTIVKAGTADGRRVFVDISGG